VCVCVCVDRRNASYRWFYAFLYEKLTTDSLWPSVRQPFLPFTCLFDEITTHISIIFCITSVRENCVANSSFFAVGPKFKLQRWHTHTHRTSSIPQECTVEYKTADEL